MGFDIAIGELLTGETRGGVKYMRRDRLNLGQTIKYEELKSAPVIQNPIRHNRMLSGKFIQGDRLYSGGRTNRLSLSYGYIGRLQDVYPDLDPVFTRWTQGHGNGPYQEIAKIEGPDLAAFDKARLMAKDQGKTDDMEVFRWFVFWIYYALSKYKDKAYVAMH